MGEWQRLTPPNVTGIPSYVKCIGEDAVYYLATGMNADDNVLNAHPLGSSFGLTSAELNALSRHAPEVKALVEDLREAVRICEFQRKRWLEVYEDRRAFDARTEKIDRFKTHLSPFAEASGEN